jgi:DNA excision repair protein ERCC-2
LEFGVREFLSMTLKVGGLSAEFTPRARAAAGTAAHTAVTATRPEGYQREVSVRHVFEHDGVRLIVRGRLDGVQPCQDGVMIEEIKSTYLPLDRIIPEREPFHLAQLRLYHHFEVQRRPGQRIIPILTYVHPQTLQERSFTMDWEPEESRQYFEALAIMLLQAEAEKRQWQKVRNASLSHLPFPFPTRRSGQTELIGTVEQAIRGHRDALVEAATGIGKTMGVLYPAIRLLSGKRQYARVFYLTAKSAGVEVARKAVGTLRAHGAHLRVLYLTAKERICPFAGDDKPECDEQECPYAEEFYTRLERLMPTLLQEEEWTPEFIAAVAAREALCPFELSLELALFADLIVCDYNYVFDPSVYLRRFFAPGLPNNNLFLVDEAHNLVPRSREMYSALLQESAVATIRTLFGTHRQGLSQSLARVLAQFASWRDAAEWEGAQALRLDRIPEELTSAVESVLDYASDLLVSMPRGDARTQLLEFYIDLSRFARTAAEITSEYALYVQFERRDARLHVRCLHPGPLLRTRLERSIATIFFSATLAPTRYFAVLLGLRDGYSTLSLPSPFPPENRLYLHVPDVSTKFVAREATRPSVAQVLANVVRAQPGNYLAFFPSYAYLGAVWAEVMLGRAPDIAVHVQQPGMSTAQQEAFLSKVCTARPEGANLGLAVMGGLFGEAIDLPGDALIGTIIVGPGLPAVNMQQELIREYFDTTMEDEGFFYAYTVPGMIRVIQAAGRVFRTPQDRGVVVLMDDRFLEDTYRGLLPEDWCADDAEFSTLGYQETLAGFWGEG